MTLIEPITFKPKPTFRELAKRFLVPETIDELTGTDWADKFMEAQSVCDTDAWEQLERFLKRSVPYKTFLDCNHLIESFDDSCTCMDLDENANRSMFADRGFDSAYFESDQCWERKALEQKLDHPLEALSAWACAQVAAYFAR